MWGLVPRAHRPWPVCNYCLWDALGVLSLHDSLLRYTHKQSTFLISPVREDKHVKIDLNLSSKSCLPISRKPWQIQSIPTAASKLTKKLDPDWKPAWSNSIIKPEFNSAALWERKWDGVPASLLCALLGKNILFWGLFWATEVGNKGSFWLGRFTPLCKKQWQSGLKKGGGDFTHSSSHSQGVQITFGAGMMGIQCQDLGLYYVCFYLIN